MLKAKVQWTQPQLIVLTRGMPEESVLTHCKRISQGPLEGPYVPSQYVCDDTREKNCGNCQARAGS